MANEVVKYESGGVALQLSSQTVRQYLVNGSGRPSDQEVMMFMQLCRARQMNPFTREAYLIKYSDNAPASIVTGKDWFTRKAAEHPQCGGWEAGVVVVTANAEVIDRPGSLLLPGDTLVGGWVVVRRRDWQPMKHAVALSEYLQVPNSGKPGQWQKMPATMIRKVAILQGLREAFPDIFGGVYGQEEMPLEDAEALPVTEVRPVAAEVVEAPPVETPAASVDTTTGEVIDAETVTEEQPSGEMQPLADAVRKKREAATSKEPAETTSLRSAIKQRVEAELTPALRTAFLGGVDPDTATHDELVALKDKLDNRKAKKPAGQ